MRVLHCALHALLLALCNGDWRQLLRRAPHAVLVDEERRATPSEPLWSHHVRLGSRDAFCELPAPNLGRRDAAERVARLARWAPLRHRCHSWRRTEEGLSTSKIAWVFRVCFSTEAVAVAPAPWLDRLELGWYNESLDQYHANGSVTLHYVNGFAHREMAVRCHCGEGPKMTFWTGDEDGNQTLDIQLPSCCPLRRPNATPMSSTEAFHWLAAPLHRLEPPCLAMRRGRWDFHLCFDGNLTQVKLSRSPVQSPQAFSFLGGPALNEVRFVPAEPAVPGQAVVHSTPGADPAFVASAAVPAPLAEALAPKPRGAGPRAAAELTLQSGEVCRSSNGTEHHQVHLRFICPANWLSSAPDTAGGHSALIAVERPQGCRWVAWVATLLLCAEPRLRPPPAEERRAIHCRDGNEEAEGSQPRHPSVAGEAETIHEADSAVEGAPRRDRSGIMFRVGQIVVNVADGTLSVVAGWDREPNPKILALRRRQNLPDESTSSPHCLLAALAGQLPQAGILRSDAMGLPGKISYVSQDQLRAYHGPQPDRLTAASSLGLTPTGSGGYMPISWLAALYPLDVQPQPEGGPEAIADTPEPGSWRTIGQETLLDLLVVGLKLQFVHVVALCFFHLCPIWLSLLAVVGAAGGWCLGRMDLLRRERPRPNPKRLAFSSFRRRHSVSKSFEDEPSAQELVQGLQDAWTRRPAAWARLLTLDRTERSFDKSLEASGRSTLSSTWHTWHDSRISSTLSTRSSCGKLQLSDSLSTRPSSKRLHLRPLNEQVAPGWSLRYCELLGVGPPCNLRRLSRREAVIEMPHAPDKIQRDLDNSVFLASNPRSRDPRLQRFDFMSCPESRRTVRRKAVQADVMNCTRRYINLAFRYMQMRYSERIDYLKKLFDSKLNKGGQNARTEQYSISNEELKGLANKLGLPEQEASPFELGSPDDTLHYEHHDLYHPIWHTKQVPDIFLGGFWWRLLYFLEDTVQSTFEDFPDIGLYYQDNFFEDFPNIGLYYQNNTADPFSSAGTMASSSGPTGGGIPLHEFRKDIPPGWAPNLPDYPLRMFFERLKLWYSIFDGDDTLVGPLVAGRLQGKAQRLGMQLRLVRPDGQYDALCNSLKDAFGMSDQEIVSRSIEDFFEFKRGKMSFQEYAIEWDIRLEEATTKAGLEMNDVAKFYLFFRGSGLPQRFIEDVKLQLQGDLRRYQDARTIALRLITKRDDIGEAFYEENEFGDYGEHEDTSWDSSHWTDDSWSWVDETEADYDDPWLEDSYYGEEYDWYGDEEDAGYAVDPPEASSASYGVPAASDDPQAAYPVKGKGKGLGCTICGSRWHTATSCPVNGGKSFSKGKGKTKGKSKGYRKGTGKGKGKQGQMRLLWVRLVRLRHELWEDPDKELRRDNRHRQAAKTVHFQLDDPDPPVINLNRSRPPAEEPDAENHGDATAAAATTARRLDLSFPTSIYSDHSTYHTIRGEKRRGLLVDPGAASGPVGSETLRDILESRVPGDKTDMVQWRHDRAHSVSGISGTPEATLGEVSIPLQLSGASGTFSADVLGGEGSMCPALLSNPSLRRQKAAILCDYFHNGDGVMVVSDGADGWHYLRILLTDSGHYLLPIDLHNDVAEETQTKISAQLFTWSGEISKRWGDVRHCFLQAKPSMSSRELERSDKESVTFSTTKETSTATSVPSNDNQNKTEKTSSTTSVPCDDNQNKTEKTSSTTSASSDDNQNKTGKTSSPKSGRYFDDAKHISGHQVNDAKHISGPRPFLHSPAVGRQHEQDTWVIDGEYLVRVHSTPRRSLFVPGCVLDCPVNQDLFSEDDLHQGLRPT
eukprot:s1424_g4.t1